MNFISHYYFDAIPSDYNYNTGLILPDFIRHFIKPFKLDKSWLLDEKIASAIQGCERHLERDKDFHGHPDFLGVTQEIFDIFHQHNLIQERTRLFFVAHIMLEILIDRYIINKLSPITIDNFYNDLSLFQHHTLPYFSELVLQTKSADFQRFFNRFLQSKFLYDYKTKEGVFKSINRLLIRSNQLPYEVYFFPIFEDIFGRLEIIAEKHCNKFLRIS
jgi:hypothetical protein